MSANPSTDLLVITSASGKQIAALLPLLTDWKTIRLVTRRPSFHEALSAKHPHATVVTADLTSPADCRRILEGATCVYHIGPSFHPHETAIGQNMIDAAVQETKSTGAKFRHFVYSSVLNSQLRKLMNHDCKRYVEEYLMESGLNYTILQPTHFMDMFPIAKFVEDESSEVVYPANWNPAVEFSFIALSDLAEAGKRVLEERVRHYRAAYPLVGTDPMSYNTLCDIAGEIVGKKVIAKQLGLEESVEWRAPVLFVEQGSKDVRMVDGLERLFLYYNRHGLVGNKNVLEWLLGKKPLGFREWAESKTREMKEK